MALSSQNCNTFLYSVIEQSRRWFYNHPIIRKFAVGISIGFGVLASRNIFWMCYYKYYRYPPCVSVGVPLLGCIPSFAKDANKFVLSTACGDGKLPITTVPIGTANIIFVNEINAAKKVLKTNAIGKNRGLFANNYQNPMNFAFINGEQWQKRRKFFQSTFGVITNSSFIYSTIKDLFEKDLYPNHINKAILNDNGKLYMSGYCGFMALRTIMTAVFGDKLDIANTALFHKQFFVLNTAILKPFALYQAYEAFINIKFPFLFHILPVKPIAHKQLILMKNLLVKNNILNENREWNKLNKDQSIMVKKMIDNDIDITTMIHDIITLLQAGVSTTSTQIEFGLIMLCKHPDVQNTIFNELSKFDEYKPSLISQLHFLRAFVYEILRFGVFLPLGLSHKCYGENVEINGYKIYKGSIVVINHTAIHHQQPNGTKFDINRWLDDDGKFNKKCEIDSFIIFSYGARDCAGKNVAIREIYSVFALLIRKYIMYNNDLPDQIKTKFGFVKEIEPEIPIYFKHR